MPVPARALKATRFGVLENVEDSDDEDSEWNTAVRESLDQTAKDQRSREILWQEEMKRALLQSKETVVADEERRRRRRARAAESVRSNTRGLEVRRSSRDDEAPSGCKGSQYTHDPAPSATAASSSSESDSDSETQEMAREGKGCKGSRHTYGSAPSTLVCRDKGFRRSSQDDDTKEAHLSEGDSEAMPLPSELLGSVQHLTIHESIPAGSPPCFLRNGWRTMASIDDCIQEQLEQSTPQIERGVAKHRLQQQLKTQQTQLQQARHQHARTQSQPLQVDDPELEDSEDETDNEDGINLQQTDHRAIETEVADSTTSDGNWLQDVDSQAYEDRLWERTRAGAWLHGLSDLPTPSEYAALSTAPEPDEYVNPVGMREDAPFTGGCVHGDDPVQAAEEWRRRIPNLSLSVYRWIADGQYTLHFNNEARIDHPRVRCNKRAQQELDKSIRKHINMRTVRLWDRSVEGSPTFCTPVFSTPKKNDAEVWRLIDDFREPNERLQKWRVRYERLSHLAATGAKQGDWAISMDFKSGYHVLRCGPDKFLAFRCRVKYSWLLELCGADASKAADALRAEGQVPPEPNMDSDPWVNVTLAWIALIMGLTTASAVYSRMIRQLVKKWRKIDGIACLNYLDDTLATAHSKADLTAKVKIMVADCKALGLPISFTKSVLEPVQRLVWCGFLLDFRSGRIHITNDKAGRILTVVEKAMTNIRTSGTIVMRLLAKVVGMLMAASRALQPVRLWSRECYALITARSEAEWNTAITVSPGAWDEICFWAAHLMRWNAIGRRMFPETRPVQIKIRGDAGPQGWGARVMDLASGQASESYDRWDPADENQDQTMRELTGLQMALQAADGDGVDFHDRTVRARLIGAEAAHLLAKPVHEVFAGLRRSSKVAGQSIVYEADNTGVRSYVQSGGGRSLRLTAKTKEIWLWLLQRGSRLDVSWVAGSIMVDSGVDALSRRRWAEGATWRWRKPAFIRVCKWIKHWGTPRVVTAADVKSGAAYTQPLGQDNVLICFPGQNRIVDWVSHILTVGALSCVITPQWHGPAMSALRNHRVAQQHLGPAFTTFVGDGEIPAWLMVATLVDCRRQQRNKATDALSRPLQQTPLVPVDAHTIATLENNQCKRFRSSFQQPPKVPTTGRSRSSDEMGDGPTIDGGASGASQPEFPDAMPASQWQEWQLEDSDSSTSESDDEKPPRTVKLRPANRPPHPTQESLTPAANPNEAASDGNGIGSGSDELRSDTPASSPPRRSTRQRVEDAVLRPQPSSSLRRQRELAAGDWERLSERLQIRNSVHAVNPNRVEQGLFARKLLIKGFTIAYYGRYHSDQAAMLRASPGGGPYVIARSSGAPHVDGAAVHQQYATRVNHSADAPNATLGWDDTMGELGQPFVQLLRNVHADEEILADYGPWFAYQQHGFTRGDGDDDSDDDDADNSDRDGASGDGNSSDKQTAAISQTTCAHCRQQPKFNEYDFCSRSCGSRAKLMAQGAPGGAAAAAPRKHNAKTDDAEDAQLAEAIKRSLEQDDEKGDEHRSPPRKQPAPETVQMSGSAVYRISVARGTRQLRDVAVQTVPAPMMGSGPPQYRQRTLQECIKIRTHPLPGMDRPIAYADPQVPSVGKEFSSDSDGDGPGNDGAPTNWRRQLQEGFASVDKAHSAKETPSGARAQLNSRDFNSTAVEPCASRWQRQLREGWQSQTTFPLTSRDKWQRSSRGGGRIGNDPKNSEGARAGIQKRQQTWAIQPAPWGRRDRPDTAKMNPTQLLQHAQELQVASRAESTKVNYLHWWRVFAEFCVWVGWAAQSTAIKLPVPDSVVLQWIAQLSSQFAASTISIGLAAVATVHNSHGVQSPTTASAVGRAVEGVARTEPVRGVTQVAVITPDIIRMFLKLDSVRGSGKTPWSFRRVLRAVAAAVTGFVAFLRKGEVDQLDICDISRETDCTRVVVKKAKNDAVGRGRSTVIGARMGDAAFAERSIWDWVRRAGISRSPQCTKQKWPSERCRACGPLFPQLHGKAGNPSKNPWGKSALRNELRELLRECVRRTWLPASFPADKITPIYLRRGGNTAAAAAGASSLIRAAQGRWRCIETPDEKYTTLHRTEMVELATKIFT